MKVNRFHQKISPLFAPRARTRLYFYDKDDPFSRNLLVFTPERSLVSFGVIASQPIFNGFTPSVHQSVIQQFDEVDRMFGSLNQLVDSVNQLAEKRKIGSRYKLRRQDERVWLTCELASCGATLQLHNNNEFWRLVSSRQVHKHPSIQL